MQPQRIVLPEAMDPRMLSAAEELTMKGLAKVILLGEPEAVTAEARRLNIDISGVSSRPLPSRTCQIWHFIKETAAVVILQR